MPSFLTRLLPLLLIAQMVLAAQQPPVSFKAVTKYPSGGYGNSSLAVGDVNGDGRSDLIIANTACADCVNSQVSVLLGNGDGTFQPATSYPAGIEADGVAVGDLNGDGKLDVVVANLCRTVPDPNCSSGGGVSVLVGNGNGSFQAPVTYNSGAFGTDGVAIADVNGDTHLDIVVADYCLDSSNCTVDGAVGVFLGNGDGTFRPAITYDSEGTYGLSVAVGDVNGDGHPDLFVANAGPCGSCGNGGLSVFFGNGDGTFRAPAVYGSGAWETAATLIGDVDGDGHPDLVTANFCLTFAACDQGGIVSVLLNNANGSFSTPQTYGSGGLYSYALANGDVNGDGKIDLIALSQCTIGNSNCGSALGRVGVLPANGDGTFQTAVTYGSGGRYPVSVVVGDVNGDQKPDLLVSNDCTTARCAGAGAIGTVGVFLNNFTAVTTTAVTSSPNPSSVNEVTTITATVTASSSIPNGSIITFYRGATQIGTGTTTNGVATLTTSFTKAATYTVKAKYSSDIFHKPSSGTIKQVVQNDPAQASDDNSSKAQPLGLDKRCGTQTTLSSSGSPSLFSDDVTFTVEAMANDVCRRGEQITCDDGGVAFYDGSTLIGNIPLRNCRAVFDTASLTVGQHLITARFNPPADWHQSYARVSHVVERQPTSTTLTSSPNPSLLGQEVVFTATAISPLGLASGKVRFAVAGNSIAIVPVDLDGVATLDKKNLPIGTNSITAEYLGDSDNKPSTSAPWNQLVDPN